MPFARPTFSEILDRVKADIDSRLPGSDAKLRRSTLSVIAYIVAGAAHGMYGFLAFIAKQVFPDTAETEYLNRWGSIWSVSRKEATKASGTVTATGTNSTVIPSGTELQRSDQAIFLTTASATIASGTATLEVEAQEAGEDGNTGASSTLSFVSPISGVDSDTTVSADGLTGGTDIEEDADYLSRILARIQEPPHGGRESDYEQWALEVSGVTRAWVYPQELGAGTVSVRFMMDDTYADGIPQAGDVSDVQDYIDERRPVTADVTVVAPTAVPLNFTIQLLIEDTAEIRTAIEEELEDMIRRDAEPAGTIYLSRINEAISTAAGEFAHTLTVPAANATHTTGQIATMGTITWG